MSEELTVIQLEYRRLRWKVFKGIVVFVLVPFAFQGIVYFFAAPPLVLSVGMAVMMIGVIISVLYVMCVWRCPACGRSLSPGGGTLGGKCLNCQAQLYEPRRSKSGRVYP